VADVMTRNVTSAPLGCGYKQLVDVLVRAGISAVPVVGGDLRVVGLVSEADLLYKAEFDGADVRDRLIDRRRQHTAKEKAAGGTAGALMTSPAITVLDTATVVEAAKLMERHGVKRLPVLDAAGELVGIVSRRDLLRRYLRDDEAIRHDVLDGVLRRTLWLDPLETEVEVTDGRVTLRGKVDRRSTARIAVELIRGLDGVVGVHDDELGWDVDDTVGARRRHTVGAELS